MGERFAGIDWWCDRCGAYYNVPIELDRKLRNLNELDRIRVRNYPKKEGSNRYEKTAVYSRVQNKGGTGTP